MDSLATIVDSTVYRTATARELFGRRSVLCDGDVAGGGYREATVGELFGDTSYMAAGELPPALEPSLVGEPLFHFLVVGFVVVYGYMLLRSWHFIGSIWGGFLDYRRSEQDMAYAGGELPISRFKLTAAIMGIVTVALVSVRLVDDYLPATAELYEHPLSSYLSLVAVLIVLAILLWSILLHALLAWTTRSNTTKTLLSIGYINFVRCVVVLFLPTAVWLVAPANLAEVVALPLVVMLFFFVAVYLKDTFMFFLEKKISIFHWFLYLCTAILLPASFVAVWITKMVG